MAKRPHGRRDSTLDSHLLGDAIQDLQCRCRLQVFFGSKTVGWLRVGSSHLITGLWPAFLLLAHVTIIRLIRVHANRGTLLPEQFVSRTKPPAPENFQRAIYSRRET